MVNPSSRRWWQGVLCVSLVLFAVGSAGLGYEHARGQRGRLVIHTSPEALVHLDAVDMDVMTPVPEERALAVEPGPHVVTFITPTLETHRYLVVTGPGLNRLVLRLGDAPTEGRAELLDTLPVAEVRRALQER